VRDRNPVTVDPGLQRERIDSGAPVSDTELEKRSSDAEQAYARRCRIAEPVPEAEATGPRPPRSVEDDVIAAGTGEDDAGDEPVTSLPTPTPLRPLGSGRARGESGCGRRARVR